MKLIKIKYGLQIAVVFQLLFFVSCHKPSNNKTKTNGLFTKNFVVDGSSRRYAIYIPKNLGHQPVPLIFELHGGGVYIEDMTGTSGHKTPYKLWMPLADIEKFIVIYPEGLNGAYNKPTWHDCRGDCVVYSDADDVRFIAQLINHIETKYLIDQNRIYVSGTSNGGFMAQRLGLELNDKIAAVASIAAAKPAISDCNPPTHPISILFMNGTDDNHMPYNGGTIGNPPNPDNGTVLSTNETIDYWVNFDHTDTIPETHTFPDLDPNDGGIVQKFSYKNGNLGTEVVLYKINGGGHSAPSIRERYSAIYEQYFNKQNHDIEITTEVWNFFKNKRLNP